MVLLDVTDTIRRRLQHGIILLGIAALAVSGALVDVPRLFATALAVLVGRLLCLVLATFIKQCWTA